MFDSIYKRISSSYKANLKKIINKKVKEMIKDNRLNSTFNIYFEDEDMIKNIIKDLSVKFNKKGIFIELYQNEYTQELTINIREIHI